MLILGIDTAAKTASTAILDAGSQKIMAEMRSSGRFSHSENLMPMIDATLKCAGVGLNEIGLFAAAKGPGSFTGIRIAVSTAKGLAFGSDERNCAGVSSLLSLAYNFYGHESDVLVFPAIDARRKQVYNAVFENLEYIKSDRVITISELEAELNTEFSGRKVAFVGDGAGMCNTEINFEGIVSVPDILKLPSAASLCLAAYGQYKKGGALRAGSLSPAYLIKTQAEREYNDGN